MNTTGQGVAKEPTLVAMVDDPIARWQFINARRETVIDQIREIHGDPGDYWENRAKMLGSQLRVDPTLRFPLLDQVTAMVGPETTVLDVGAGWGRFAIPLATVARSVTAVEPANGLIARFRENIANADLAEGRLQLVESTWEDADVPPADIVLCSNVVMPILDIGPFLQKLDAHTLRQCLLIMRAVPMDAPITDLWEQIHQVPYPRETAPADLLAALAALNIPAQMTLLPSDRIWAFSDREAAAKLVRSRLWLGPVGHDQRADQLVDEWLTTNLQQEADRYVIKGSVGRAALIWWEK